MFFILRYYLVLWGIRLDEGGNLMITKNEEQRKLLVLSIDGIKKEKSNITTKLLLVSGSLLLGYLLGALTSG